MFLRVDENRKKDIVRQAKKQNSRYFVQSLFRKVFGIAQWALPVLLCIVRAGKMLMGASFQRYQWLSLAFQCGMMVVVFGFAKWALRFFNNLFTGGFTQDNRDETVELSVNGDLVYSFSASGKKREVRIWPVEIRTFDGPPRAFIRGRIQTSGYRGGTKRVISNRNGAVTLYDYFEPSLIEGLNMICDSAVNNYGNEKKFTNPGHQAGTNG